MASTRDFKETIRDRVTNAPAFRETLLREDVERLLSCDVGIGETLFRKYIDAPGDSEESGRRA